MAKTYRSDYTAKDNSIAATNTSTLHKFSSLQNSSGTSNPVFAQRSVSESTCQSLPDMMQPREKEIESFFLARRKVESLTLGLEDKGFCLLVADVNKTMLTKRKYSKLATMIADGTMDKAKHDQLMLDEVLLNKAKDLMKQRKMEETKINLLSALAELMDNQ